MTFRHTASAAGIAALYGLSGPGAAQEAGPDTDLLKSVRMVRTETPPAIDGRLDDPV